MDATATLALLGAAGAGVALGTAIGSVLSHRRQRQGLGDASHWLAGLVDADAAPGAPPPSLDREWSGLLQAHADRIGEQRAACERRWRDAADDALSAMHDSEAAQRARLRLLDTANHDLRQPLQALHLALSRLRVRIHPELRIELEPIEDAVAGIQDLLDRWLQLARLDSGQLIQQAIDCELQPLFDALAANMAGEAQARGVRLVHRARGRSVLADPGLLEPLLASLLENAVRATPAGGCVLLTARDRAGGVRVEVRDNGIGIAPIHHERVFEEFFQIGNSERDRRKGLGLGLAIAARLATLMGSRLRLCSRLRAGSCFFLELPRAGNAHAPLALLVAPPGERRDWLSSLLTSWGWRTLVEATPDAIAGTFAATGGQSIRTLVCALEDAHVPGWQAVEAALERNPSLAVAILCDAPDPAVMDRASRLGATLLSGQGAAAKLRALLSAPRSIRPAAA